jgi:hypothetical protein
MPSFATRYFVTLFLVLACLDPTVYGQPTRSDRSTRPSRSTPAKSEVSQAIHRDVDRDESDEDEPVVVSASCKNCQSTTGAVTSIPTPVADYEVIGNETHREIVAGRNQSSCDAACGAGCGSSFGFADMGNGRTGFYLPWCMPSCCDANSCGSPLAMLSRRVYLRAEAAWFWSSGQNLPALITTSDADPLPPPADAGTFEGDDDTRSLFGGNEVGKDSTNGLRGEFGLWLDDCQSRGAVIRMFDAGDNDVGFRTNNTENAFFALFFRQADPGPALEPTTVVLAYPALSTGSVDANLSSTAYGGDILYRSLICQDDLGRWDWLVGYQTARLQESLDIVSRTRDESAPNPVLEQEDHFRARSQFHGGALGLQGQVRDGCWYFGGLCKFGIGNMERQVDIFGSSRTTVGTSVSTQNQGLLARRTNSGTTTNDTFVIVPELGLTAGYRLTGCLDFTVGYSLLRLPKVHRVSDTLDDDLASNLSDPLTGATRPSFIFRESNFSLHSLNLGLQWSY